MTLTEYLDKEGKSQQWLADKLGVTQQMVSVYLSRGLRDYTVMLKIQQATDNAVKPKDWLK